mgnify:CR=1 FL=1
MPYKILTLQPPLYYQARAIVGGAFSRDFIQVAAKSPSHKYPHIQY